MFSRTKIAAVSAEFLGVAVITAVVLAISRSGMGFSLFIALGIAIAVAMMALAVGVLSGAHFNPAVTIGLWTVRRIRTAKAVVYLGAQLLGAVAAWRLYEYLTDSPLRGLAEGVFDWRIFTAEAVGAFVLTFVVASAIYQGYASARFAATLGGAFFLGALIASIASNGLANPALALGLQSWSVAYVAGPIAGGVIGINLYHYLFAPSNMRANSGINFSSIVVRRRSNATTAKAKKSRSSAATKRTKKTASKPVARKRSTAARRKK